MKNEISQAYSEEILIACQNGKPCDYGICDECPNTLGSVKDDKGE
jgi:hypothetical protein